jgi:hypothetical protein
MYLLDTIRKKHNGRIEFLKTKKETFLYTFREEYDLLYLINEYLTKFPLKTTKQNKIPLIKEFYLKNLD